MTSRFLSLSTPLAAAGAVLLVASPAFAATWETITDYGGTTNMVIYVPDNVDASPGVAVALHSCGNQYEGDSQNYFRSSADQYGFIIIAPTNGTPDCWNATAGQDGEKPDIVRMVEWVVANRNADATRVYVGGASSGACMTAAMLSTHPDVFAGGTMMAGVPFGAWSGGGSCGVCGQSPNMRSEQEWGDLVRSNAPQGFTGPWPRLQVWHGSADTTLLYGWETETEKQWKNLWELSGDGMSVTGPNGWDRTQYEADGMVVLQVNRGPGLDHYLPDDIPQDDMIAFFGLDQDGSPDSGESSGGSDGGSDDDGGDTTSTTGADGTDTSGGTTSGAGTTTGGTTTGIDPGTSTSGTSGTSGAADDDDDDDDTTSSADDDDDDNDDDDSGDSSPANDDAGDGGGCACDVPGRSANRSTLELLFVAGLGGMMLRRRRRRLSGPGNGANATRT